MSKQKMSKGDANKAFKAGSDYLLLVKLFLKAYGSIGRALVVLRKERNS